jgi:putative hydrolase of the HAD superfamily
MQKPKVLLFDLGGVIVRWTGLEELSALTGLSREAVLATFDASGIFKAYQIGQCDDATFITALIDEFKLNMSPEIATQLWQLWVGETYVGIKEALTELRQKYTIACLSNTNALHWAWLENHIATADYFDYSYASHLIKAAKPDLECYHIPIQGMGISPSDIWFFDDTMENIEAAKSAGMQAFHVDREFGVIPVLQTLKLLP